MRKIISSVILFFLFFSAYAQIATISGRVVSKINQEGLPGASVIVDHSTNGTITDVDGKYSLQAPIGKHSITFRMIGMKEKTEPVNLQESENMVVIMMLEDDSKELGVVVVSASKFEQKLEEVTVSMNVIKPSLVEAKNTTTMEDIIDQTPSVSVIDGQANIRGGSGWSYGAGSRVLILVDDLPQLTADAGDVKWNFLPVENLEQIEVIKGAASALYGSSALNGIINVRTAYPKAIPQTRINVYSGFYNTDEKIKLGDSTYNLNWSGSIPQQISGINFLHSRQIKNLDLIVGGNMFFDDGYREGEYENRGRFNCNTRYRFKKIDGLSCGVNLNTMYTEGSLTFIWHDDTTGAYRPFQFPGSSALISGYTTYRTNIDPFITYVGKKGSQWKLRTRYFRTNNLNNTHQESKADFYYSELQYQKRIKEIITLTTGLVASDSKVRSELYNNHEGTNLAFYLQGDLKWQRLILSFGGRIEKNRIDSLSDKLTPVLRAGLNYKLFEGTNLRASFGQGYRYPAIAEKYVTTDLSILHIYPNDSLQSEKSWSAEVGVMQGIKLGRWRGYIDAAAFYTRFNDMIEFTFSQWEKPTIDSLGFHFGVGFKALNIGETEIKGLDISLAGEGELGPLTLSLLAGYTYMVPDQLIYDSSYVKAVDGTLYKGAYLGSDSSNFLKYRYAHLAKADIGIAYKKISIGISCRYNSIMKNVDKLFVDTVFYGPLLTPGVKHYRDERKTGDLIFDARVSYQIIYNAKFAFIVKNVFNYIFMQRPADMQPPRTFTGQLTITF